MRIPSAESFAGSLTEKAAPTRQEVRPRQATERSSPAEACAPVDVTVVTVCFNPLAAGRKELLLKNLESVQQQQDIRLEHVIVDGGSTDGTLPWLLAFQPQRHDLRILSLPDNGIYEAMNRGIALARGRFVAFLNSDDFFHHPSGMADSIGKIRQTKCDFSFAPVRFSDPSVRHNPQLAPQRRLHRFIVSWCFSHQSMLTSRALLLQIDGFDTRFRSAADFDLLLRLLAAGARGCFVPLNFATFTLGGFSCEEANRQLIGYECATALQQFYRNFLATDMTFAEASYLFQHHVFPRRQLLAYKKTQQLIRERFVVPGGPVACLARSFNYIKYYYKCLKANA